MLKWTKPVLCVPCVCVLFQEKKEEKGASSVTAVPVQQLSKKMPETMWCAGEESHSMVLRTCGSRRDHAFPFLGRVGEDTHFSAGTRKNFPVSRPGCVKFATIPKINELTDTRPGARTCPERMQQRRQDGTERKIYQSFPVVLYRTYRMYLKS